MDGEVEGSTTRPRQLDRTRRASPSRRRRQQTAPGDGGRMRRSTMEQRGPRPCRAARGLFSLLSRRGSAGRRRRRMPPPPPSREERRSGRGHGAIRARRPRARSQRNETATGLEEEASLARPPRRVNARDASPSWKCEPAANPPPAPRRCRHLTCAPEASIQSPGEKGSTPDLGRPFGPRARTRTGQRRWIEPPD